MSRTLGDYYISTLKESKEQGPPNFDDTSRGVLLALIKERPTIWNSSAKLTRDDVLASFHQISAVLSNMDPRFNIWAIIEKWCWVVESYVRCTLTNPPTEWRYNNTLEYLKPFAAANYPYLGCLSKKRRNELTKLYADPEIVKAAEATEEVEFQGGIFKEEMHVLSGDEQLIQLDIESMALSRTVGQVMNAKRRGRPSKADKRSPVDHTFITLTPQSAQFQKLLEASNGASTFNAVSLLETEAADDFGFTPAMYNALIEMIQDKPILWQIGHSQQGNIHMRDQAFEDIGARLMLKFKDTVDVFQLEKLTGSYVRKVWERLRDKYKLEESSDTVSKWKYFQHLQFLSTRLMPAFLLENIFIKNEDPSTSSGFSTRLNVASPAGSSQSDDSRMATSSPASAVQFGTLTNGNKKDIQTVLDNLVARSKKEDANGLSSTIFQPSELKALLEAKVVPKIEVENGPPTKRIRQESSSPTGGSRMIVYNNDTRQAAQAPISTWVPPIEDVNAKGKEEVMSTPPQRRAQATAVIKSGVPLEKQLKKMLQQGPTLIPVTASGQLPQRGNLMALNAFQTIHQSAIQQALLRNTPTTAASIPSVSTAQLHQTPSQPVTTNGIVNGCKTEKDDKWTYLGKLLATTARELEAHDPMAGCNLQNDISQLLYKYSVKSIQKRENNS